MIFSDHLKKQLQDKSHAMLEDMLTYEDEGVHSEDRLSKIAVAGIVLDHIDQEAIAEYRTHAAVDPDKALEEAAKHVYEA